MRKNKDRGKGFERKNKTGNHKKEKRLMKKKKLQFNIFMLFFFNETKAKKKEK